MCRRLPCGFVEMYAPCVCDVFDPETILNGLLKRILFQAPEVDPTLKFELKLFSKTFAMTHLHPLSQRPEYKPWRDSLSFPESRKLQYDKAYQDNGGMRPPAKICHATGLFGKREGYLSHKYMRGINPRNLRWNVYCGPFFSAIEEEVYSLEQLPGLPYFVKHTPVPERINLVKQLIAANIYGTDYSHFEGSITVDIMECCEVQLYKFMLQNFAEDFDFIKSIITGMNVMKTKYGHRYRVQARRMSGDMCTSLGNGWTNLMVALFFAYKQSAKILVLVEGDDALIATDAVFTKSMYDKLGFEIKIDTFVKATEASFCGLVFADSGQIIRDPIKFLCKFGWTFSFVTAGEKVMWELLLAKSLSALFETPACPLVTAIAEYTLKQCYLAYPSLLPRYVYDWYHSSIPLDFKHVHQEISPDTRELFSKLYHIDVGTQIELEKHIADHGPSDLFYWLPPTPDISDSYCRFVEVY